MAHYLSFGALIGVSGGLVGSALGYLTSFIVMMPFVTTIAGGYLPGFTNQPQWGFILAGFSVVALGTTLAGAYPAWVNRAHLRAWRCARQRRGHPALSAACR